jgi:hypothetical protein
VSAGDDPEGDDQIDRKRVFAAVLLARDIEDEAQAIGVGQDTAAPLVDRRSRSSVSSADVCTITDASADVSKAREFVVGRLDCRARQAELSRQDARRRQDRSGRHAAQVNFPGQCFDQLPP